MAGQSHFIHPQQWASAPLPGVPSASPWGGTPATPPVAMPYATPPWANPAANQAVTAQSVSQGTPPLPGNMPPIAGMSQADQMAALQSLMNPNGDTFNPQTDGSSLPKIPKNPLPGLIMGSSIGIALSWAFNHLFQDPENGVLMNGLKTLRDKNMTPTWLNSKLEGWFKSDRPWAKELLYALPYEETKQNWLKSYTAHFIEDKGGKYQAQITKNLANLRKDADLEKLLTGVKGDAKEAFAHLEGIQKITNVEENFGEAITKHITAARRQLIRGADAHIIERHLNKLPENLREMVKSKATLAEVEECLAEHMKDASLFEQYKFWGESPHRFMRGVNKEVSALTDKIVGGPLARRLGGLKNRLTGLRFTEYKSLADLEQHMLKENIGFVERKAVLLLQHIKRTIGGETSSNILGNGVEKGVAGRWAEKLLGENIGGSATKLFDKAPSFLGPVLQGAFIFGSAINAMNDAPPGEKLKTLGHTLVGGFSDFLGWEIGGIVLETLITAFIPELAAVRFLRWFSVGGFLNFFGSATIFSNAFSTIGERISHMILGKPKTEIDEENKAKGISSSSRNLRFNTVQDTPTAQQFSAALSLERPDHSDSDSSETPADTTTSAPVSSLSPAEIRNSANRLNDNLNKDAQEVEDKTQLPAEFDSLVTEAA